MKRSSLLQHLRRHGCVLKREGRGHSLWTILRPALSKQCPAILKSPMGWLEKSAAALAFQKSAPMTMLANERRS